MKEQNIACIQKQAKKTGMVLDEQILNRLEIYVRESLFWTKMHNVSGLRSEDQVVEQGIIDSMRLVPFLNGKTLVDVGSGAGLPGLIIGIICTGLEVCLTEQRSKKIAFLKRAVRSCGLQNRVEIIDVRQKPVLRIYDNATSRAFSNLENTFNACSEYVVKGGRVILPRSVDDSEKCLAGGARLFTYNNDATNIKNRAIAIYDL